MKRTKDPLYRVACDLHQQLERLTRSTADQQNQQFYNLDATCQSVSRSWRRHRLAHSRGWRSAQAQIKDQLLSQIRRLQEYAQELTYRPQPSPAALPPVSLLLAELRQLEEEFEQVLIGPGKSMISAVTEPIILEEVPLGPFRIELHLHRLSRPPGSACFDCVALDPNPAQSNDSITHPNVSGLSLCAGEASESIASALTQGRICDAFLLVASVLRNYNPSSPYVSLADWSGVRCPDCDCNVSRDDFSYCEDCDRSVCDQCISSCDVCDTSCCRSCLERDDRVRRDCCPRCRHTCSDCDRTVNSEDFDQDSGLCPQCLAQQQESEEEADTDAESVAVAEASIPTQPPKEPIPHVQESQSIQNPAFATS